VDFAPWLSAVTRRLKGSSSATDTTMSAPPVRAPGVKAARAVTPAMSLSSSICRSTSASSTGCGASGRVARRSVWAWMTSSRRRTSWAVTICTASSWPSSTAISMTPSATRCAGM
jgi:hypothetical protein